MLDYYLIARSFLELLEQLNLSPIQAVNRPNYIFYQYPAEYRQRITRPLNADLFITSAAEFTQTFDRLMTFLDDLAKYQSRILEQPGIETYLATRQINQVIYTAQQSIGCIGDSLTDSNQSRKRIGQLFENLIRLLIQQIGLTCEPRTINIPIPGYAGYKMPYELDLIFSHNKIGETEESYFIHSSEIVGSVKTTSKDRLDKIFLDKHLLTKLLGRDIPVIAIFLHDVQRARIGQSLFGVNSTFKTNHFLGYTVALNKLDGVYFVDPRPEMHSNERLREQIHDFQWLLVRDLWRLSIRI